MNRSSIRRLVTTALAGALFVLLTALGAGAVAADSTSGYAGGLNGQPPPPVAPYYPQGYGYPVAAPQYYAPAYGGYAPVYGYPPAPVYAPTGCAGYCGYTAAGPIVGYDANGSTLVYDTQGGTIDAYSRAPNGAVCEADTNGQCEPGQFGPGS